MVNDPILTRTPGVRCGRLCLAGTRIPVAVVLRGLAAGVSLDEIERGYPHLEAGAVRRAVEAAADILDLPADAPWAGEALETVAQLRETAAEHGCPALSDAAVRNAALVVRALSAYADLPAPRVVPGADPGVGVTVRSGHRTLYVEAGNDGSVVFCASEKGRGGWPKAAEVPPEGLAKAAAEAAGFLNWGEEVPWEVGRTE